MKDIPEDLQEQIDRFHLQKDLAHHYGVDRKVLKRWVRQAGIQVDWKARANAAQTLDEPEGFKDAFLRLGSVRAVAREYGVAEHVARRWVEQGGYQKDKSNWCPPLQRDQILLAARMNDTVKGVARFLGIQRKTLMRYCGFWDIDLPDLMARKSDIDYVLTNLARDSEEDAEESVHTVLRGAATVVQSLIADWSHDMGMRPSEANQVVSFDVSLISEELDELEQAVQSEDRVAQLDALADIVYTCFNIAYRRNFPLSAALGEVHRSNYTKTPNADGKPTKGDGYSDPDLLDVWRHWDAWKGAVK